MKNGWVQWCRNEFDSGGTGLARKWGSTVTGPRKAPEKNFWSCPSTFLALKVQLVVLVIAFVTVGTVWSVLNCLLFFYLRRLTVPSVPMQPFVKVGDHVPPVPYGCLLSSRKPISCLCGVWFHPISSEPALSRTCSCPYAVR